MLLLFPLTLAYVIVVQKAMDVRVVLRQGLQYALARNGVRTLQVLAILTGMALDPAGDRLYVATDGDTLNVHSVAADGSLTQIQAADLGTPSSAQNGVAYVPLRGGDFVYVNNNEVPNTVTCFSVLSGGALSLRAVVPTGGSGGHLGFVASPRLLAGSDQRLYVLNEGSNWLACIRKGDWRCV
jgi:DNA-binding beta-propeller fold protein YncE